MKEILSYQFAYLTQLVNDYCEKETTFLLKYLICNETDTKFFGCVKALHVFLL